MKNHPNTNTNITIRSQLFEYYSNTELFAHLWSVPTRQLPKPLSTTFPPGPPFRWLQAGSAPGGKEGHDRHKKAATVDEDQGQSDLTMVGLPNYESESKRSKQSMPPSYDESTTTLITKHTRARYHICKSTRFRETLKKLSKVKRCVSRVSFGARTHCLFRAFWHRFPIKCRRCQPLP